MCLPCLSFLFFFLVKCLLRLLLIFKNSFSFVFTLLNFENSLYILDIIDAPQIFSLSRQVVLNKNIILEKPQIYNKIANNSLKFSHKPATLGSQSHLTVSEALECSEMDKTSSRSWLPCQGGVSGQGRPVFPWNWTSVSRQRDFGSLRITSRFSFQTYSPKTALLNLTFLYFSLSTQGPKIIA